MVLRMNKHFKNYYKSLKLRRSFWYTFLVDGVFLSVLSLVLYFFNNIITQKAYVISNGKTVDELKAMLLSMDPVKAQGMLDSLRGFVFTFVGGLIVIIVGGFLLYSLTRKIIWNYLTKHKTKYWKWNTLTLVLIIPIIIYFVFFSIIKIVSQVGINLLTNLTISSLLNSLVNLIGLVGGLIFVFLVYLSFSKNYLVWDSIGKSFHLLKKRWSRVWPLFFLSLLTALILSIIAWPFTKWFANQKIILAIISGVFSLIYLAWFRIYLYRTVE